MCNRITILVDEVPFKYKKYWQLKMTLTIWNIIRSLRRIYVFLFPVSFSFAAKNWKSLNHKIRYIKKWTLRCTHEKKYWPHEYPREKLLDPWNTHGKNFGPTKYPQEKLLDPGNTHEKSFRSTKFPQEKFLDPCNTHEKNLWTYKKAQWRGGTRPTRSNMVCDSQNLAHSW